MTKVIKNNKEKNLPEIMITDTTVCILFRIFGPEMTLFKARGVNRQLKEAGGIIVGKKRKVGNFFKYLLNSGIKPFSLRTNLHLPDITFSNVFNHCKVNIHTEDKHCKKCRVSRESNSCTKKKIEEFVLS